MNGKAQEEKKEQAALAKLRELNFSGKLVRDHSCQTLVHANILATICCQTVYDNVNMKSNPQAGDNAVTHKFLPPHHSLDICCLHVL
jgi:hypothetical protein